MRLWRVLAVVVLAWIAAMSAARAHEARPAYLELKERAPGQYDVLWRTPVLAGMRLPVMLKLPDGVKNLVEPRVDELSDSLLERRSIDAGPGGLAAKRIAFPGLQLTITDVLVRVERLDGSVSTEIVHPQRAWFELAPPRSTLQSAGVFIVQGIEHILLGVDHLLFVLGLLALVGSPWMLVKTITAFTVAHSITLAIATFGIATIPAEPLNASIALSILFLAPEIVRARSGGTSFTIRHPWVVAFAFGLLHGFGFASGLAALGLPQAEIPLALLMFNVGVEIGQLAFVALVLLMARAFEVLQVRWPARLALLPAYVVGSLGAFWTIQRVVLMLGGR